MGLLSKQSGKLASCVIEDVGVKQTKSIRIQFAIAIGIQFLDAKIQAELLSTLFFPAQAFVLQSATAFNRWLMIENALAAEIPRLLVPEKSDAKTKKNPEGTLEKVEKRAEFMVLILDHFLLYLAVVSKMKDDTSSLPGDQQVLGAALRKRAVDMAKMVLPRLAVMWEKQWDNAWMQHFYPSWSVEKLRDQMVYKKDWWMCENSWKTARQERQGWQSSLEESKNRWVKKGIAWVKKKVQSGKEKVNSTIHKVKESWKRNREAKKMKIEEGKIKETSRLHAGQSECFNKGDLHLRMIQKYQEFQMRHLFKDHAYRNTDFGGKLLAAMNNQLLYEPKETRPDWCWQEWFPQQMSDFITSCLWYPLYGHRRESQSKHAVSGAFRDPGMYRVTLPEYQTSQNPKLSETLRHAAPTWPLLSRSGMKCKRCRLSISSSLMILAAIFTSTNVGWYGLLISMIHATLALKMCSNTVSKLTAVLGVVIGVSTAAGQRRCPLCPR